MEEKDKFTVAQERAVQKGREEKEARITACERKRIRQRADLNWQFNNNGEKQ
jgi:hypothetical protein